MIIKSVIKNVDLNHFIGRYKGHKTFKDNNNLSHILRKVSVEAMLEAELDTT